MQCVCVCVCVCLCVCVCASVRVQHRSNSRDLADYRRNTLLINLVCVPTLQLKLSLSLSQALSLSQPSLSSGLSDAPWLDRRRPGSLYNIT